MRKIVNAICKKIIKVKKFIPDIWDIFQQLRILSKYYRTGHTVLQRVKTIQKLSFEHAAT